MCMCPHTYIHIKYAHTYICTYISRLYVHKYVCLFYVHMYIHIYICSRAGPTYGLIGSPRLRFDGVRGLLLVPAARLFKLVQNNTVFPRVLRIYRYAVVAQECYAEGNAIRIESERWGERETDNKVREGETSDFLCPVQRIMGTEKTQPNRQTYRKEQQHYNNLSFVCKSRLSTNIFILFIKFYHGERKKFKTF